MGRDTKGLDCIPWLFGIGFIVTYADKLVEMLWHLIVICFIVAVMVYYLSVFFKNLKVNWSDSNSPQAPKAGKTSPSSSDKTDINEGQVS